MKHKRFILTRTLPIFLFFLLAYFLIYIYKMEVLEWFCVNEDNSASCYLLAGHHFEAGDYGDAEKFYRTSCRLDYVRACYALIENHMYHSDEHREELLRHACSLDQRVICNELVNNY